MALVQGVEMVDVDKLTPYPGNARRGNVQKIAESIAVHGQYKPITVQRSTGFILAGNHTTLGIRRIGEALAEIPADAKPKDAAALLSEALSISEPVARDLWARRADQSGWTQVAVSYVDVDEKQAARINVADNRLADLGTYDNQALAEQLQTMGGDFEGTGYTPQAVDDLVDLLSGIEGGDADDLPTGHNDGEAGAPVEDEGQLPKSDGSLLALADISIAEPEHDCSTNDAWQLGDKHVLLVIDVMSGWPTWQRHLEDGDLFVPYPGPYAALTTKADKQRLVMVQPDPYLAGHVLDKYTSIYGDDSTRRIEL